jgi:hypothetical protein
MDLDFVKNQVKFMYGKYYNILINNQENMININKENTFTMDDVYNNKHFKYDHRNFEYNKYFYQLVRQYCNNDIKTKIFNTDWHDIREYDEFIITHNRLYNNYNQIIFPFNGYNLPNNVKINDTVAFNAKHNKLIWRGNPSGSTNTDINKRINIVSKNFNIHYDIDIGFNNMDQKFIEKLNPFFKGSVDSINQINNKFILCIEGNDWASNFPWVLSSNCCPLHNYPFTTESYIFGQELKPYIHFVPINNDGSDLLEKFLWCLDNKDKCEEIANNGKKYMEPYLQEDLYNEVLKEFFRIYPSF